MTISLKDFIPYQDRYYILKLQCPGSHGQYAVHGGPTADDPDKIGLLVFPLLEKAEQYVLMLAKPAKNSPAVLSIPVKVSAEHMLSLAYDVGGLALNDPHSKYVRVLEFDKTRGKGVFIRALKEDVQSPMYLLTHQG